MGPRLLTSPDQSPSNQCVLPKITIYLDKIHWFVLTYDEYWLLLAMLITDLYHYSYVCRQGDCEELAFYEEKDLQAYIQWRREHMPEINDGEDDSFFSWAFFLGKCVVLAYTASFVLSIFGITEIINRLTYPEDFKVAGEPTKPEDITHICRKRRSLYACWSRKRRPNFDGFGDFTEIPNVNYQDNNQTQIAPNDHYDPGTGYMVVINNRFFGHSDKAKKREFTEKSEMDLKSLFQMFGFKTRIERDISYSQMKDLTNDIIQQLTSGKYSCLILWILSHGCPKRLVEMEDGEYLSAEDLPLMFDNEACPQMAGKPKLFLVNTCDGVESNHATMVPVDGSRAEPKMELKVDTKTIPNVVDYLIAFATTPNAPAYRNPSRGCFFVDIFCRAAKAKWAEEDLEEILWGLRRDAKPINHQEVGLVYQIPVVQTALTKKFKFQKKKLTEEEFLARLSRLTERNRSQIFSGIFKTPITTLHYK